MENKNYWYYRNENTEYFCKGSDLYHRKDNGDTFIFRVDERDNPENTDARICYLVEYKNYVVVLLTWSIRRNVLCFDKNTDELIWQLDDPKDVFKTRRNCWTRIGPLAEYPGWVHVVSIDGYRAAFDIATGKKTWEYDRKSGDPRDF